MPHPFRNGQRCENGLISLWTTVLPKDGSSQPGCDSPGLQGLLAEPGSPRGGVQPADCGRVEEPPPPVSSVAMSVPLWIALWPLLTERSELTTKILQLVRKASRPTLMRSIAASLSSTYPFRHDCRSGALLVRDASFPSTQTLLGVCTPRAQTHANARVIQPFPARQE